MPWIPLTPDLPQAGNNATGRHYYEHATGFCLQKTKQTASKFILEAREHGTVDFAVGDYLQPGDESLLIGNLIWLIATGLPPKKNTFQPLKF